MLSKALKQFCGLLLLFSVASAYGQQNLDMLTALVEDNEAQQGLPKPLLLSMLAQGVNLEDAAGISVAGSSSAEYAEAYTYYAICMSVSDVQAEDVHDTVVAQAKTAFKAAVTVEANYALTKFKDDRCDGIERSSRESPPEEQSTENAAGGRASIDV